LKKEKQRNRKIYNNAADRRAVHVGRQSVLRRGFWSIRARPGGGRVAQRRRRRPGVVSAQFHDDSRGAVPRQELSMGVAVGHPEGGPPHATPERGNDF